MRRKAESVNEPVLEGSYGSLQTRLKKPATFKERGRKLELCSEETLKHMDVS